MNRVSRGDTREREWTPLKVGVWKSEMQNGIERSSELDKAARKVALLQD